MAEAEATGGISIMEEKNKKIKRIFGARIVMWVIAAGATFYWIYWAFHLYSIGVFDVHEYAAIFRPIFGKGLLISVVSICISFFLQRISDQQKKKMEEELDHNRKANE